MAKKKKTKPKEEDVDDFGDFDDEDDGDIEIAVPKIKKDTPVEDEEPTPPPSEDVTMEEAIDEEDLEFELEEEEGPIFKFLNLTLSQGSKENDYELKTQGQSHGFCNIFVKHLLDIKGVKIAAYKVTNIEYPQIFIRLNNGHKIKDILSKGIEALREDVGEVEKLFQKLM